MPEPPKFVLGGSGLNGCSAVSYFSTLLGSIIGAGRLSFRVRDGTGRFPAAMAAVTLCKFVFPLPAILWEWCFGGGVRCSLVFVNGVVASVVVSFRPVSASSLSHCCVYRSGLSIPWSAGGLIPLKG